ncbi:MAG: MarR family transcriptional regulator [Desulfomonile tiedjei]|uniref:MarR family transcriptional regulator n=1 Tax=Desulfomonile tiedjei TaxID=2358 RepID=A0A9D6UZI5_9BACT|nr:MarR family transcriptional regulator [Desulfomonile tiedjei]
MIDPVNCPYYLVSRVTLMVTSALKKGLTKAGVGDVRPAYLGALFALWKEDGLKVVEVGRRSGLETSTMTGLIDRMERDGLVERRDDENDRRVQRINLTEKGREVMNPVLGAVDRVLATVFEGISEEDMLKATDVLKRVLANSHEGNP